MSFEIEIWREVSQHNDIETFLERVEPILTRRYRWVQGIAILTIAQGEHASRCIAATGAQASAWRVNIAHNLSEESLRHYNNWQREGQVGAWHDMSPPLRQLLGAVGGERPFAMVPLSEGSTHEGIAILTGSTSSPPVNLKQLLPLREPLAVAIRNDARTREIQRLRAAAEADRSALLQRLNRDAIDESIVGADGGLRAVMERVEQVAVGTAPVLLLGETGSGKEVIARAIHERSPRASGPMVRVNCGAIPAELIDSELFGHAKGSFTGAVSDRLGWFERADGGTLLLDEIAELPPAAQVRLLRVLQDGTFNRVGGEKTIRSDVRIVAATHRDLPAMVRDGEFREDLWYRLSVFPIYLPPLRDRKEDIGELARYFADRSGRRLGGVGLPVSEQDVLLLQHYDWPGNARELAAVIERAALLGNGRRLEIASALGMAIHSSSRRAPVVSDGFAAPGGAPSTALGDRDAHAQSLNDAIIDRIVQTLRQTGGVIEGKAGAAALLGINASTLRSRMRKLDIRWEDYRASISLRSGPPT